MNKKLFFSFFISTLLISYIIVYASGGGGGGGCGKNDPNCNGGGGGGSENDWISAETNGYPYAAGQFEVGSMIAACNTNDPGGTGINVNGAAFYYPNLPAQILGQQGNFLASISVQDLVTGITKSQGVPVPGLYSNNISTPRYHAFRLSYMYITSCSQCMDPFLITLPVDEGRRVKWLGSSEFAAGTTYISLPTLYYSGLLTCN